MSRVTIKDIYLGYPYKWRDTTSNTVSIPYFPKDQITNNDKSLDYKTWKNIILTYHKYLLEFLLTGRNYITPHNVGHFQIQKIKSVKSNINWKKTKERYGSQKGKENKKFIRYKNNHWGGYRPLVKWNIVPVKLTYKYHFKFRPMTDFMRKINNRLDTDKSILNFKDK